MIGLLEKIPHAAGRANDGSCVGPPLAANSAPRRFGAGGVGRDAHGYAAPRMRRLRMRATLRRRSFARARLGMARAPPRALDTWLAVRATVRPRVSIAAAGMPALRPARLIAASGRPSGPRMGLPTHTTPSVVSC